LINAVQRRASDIHLHPRERFAEVRYRIDGSLVAVGEFNRALLPSIVARIKVLAAMDLAEHRVPQDGAIHLNTPHGPVDMRVSMMPAIHWENVVIRILDPKVGLRCLADVGFSASDERRFRSLLDRNQGLVLVTGPTGSGKTTTLYAALQEMNTGEYHIVTVEDPVEYRLDALFGFKFVPPSNSVSHRRFDTSCVTTPTSFLSVKFVTLKPRKSRLRARSLVIWPYLRCTRTAQHRLSRASLNLGFPLIWSLQRWPAYWRSGSCAAPASTARLPSS
jgi:hypothetical protein